MNNIKCQVVERTSAKGNKYIALEVYLTPSYRKIVFLEQAEIELLKLAVAEPSSK